MSDLDDPEDAYDATDPVPVRLVNFDHRLGWVADRLVDGMADRVDLLAHLGRLRVDLAAAARELFP